jgi:hypothetical protein
MSTRQFDSICLLSVIALCALAGPVQALDIVVTSTLDFAEADDDLGKVDNYTCGYTSGAIFEPAPNGVCTLRRAVLEAGVRPDGDRPIRILFDLPTSDPNYDPTLEMWEVQIDSSFIWAIDRRFISDDGGQVTIDGASQSIGRDDGPRIVINTNSENNPLFGRSLEVRTSNNVIRDLGFKGGGQIILYEGGNLVENVWMGLTNDGLGLSLASDASSQARRSLARGGIIMPNSASDDNIIRNNVIIGAVERAIRVTSGGSNNQIIDNRIGTNAAGEVPIAGTIDCSRDLDYDEQLWYGGEGIQVTGSGNTITGNILAGLHKTQSTNDTPPIALEIAGIDNLVMDNTIGLDAQGSEIGVCGQGMLLQGSEGIVTDNHLFFTRNGFDPGDVDTEFDAAIIMQSFTGQGGGDPDRWMRVWNNVIDGGDFIESNFHAYRFASPGVPIEMRQFIPAKVTSIEGTTVSGTNGDPLPLGPSTDCPGCTIYLYLDDRDDRIESFELLGTATADGNGDWTTTISRELASNEGIRTHSESNAVDVMHFYDAMTTTRLSDDLYFAPASDVIFQDQFK